MNISIGNLASGKLPYIKWDTVGDNQRTQAFSKEFQRAGGIQGELFYYNMQNTCLGMVFAKWLHILIPTL